MSQLFEGGETMNRIVRASVDVFRKFGYDAARVDDVVDVAGVSHGTFYLYFRNKEDLFRATAAQILLTAAGIVRRLDLPGQAADDIRPLLVEWLGEMVSLYRRYGPVLGGWLGHRSGDVVLDAMARDMSDELVSRLSRGFTGPARDAVQDVPAAAETLAALLGRALATAADQQAEDDTARIAGLADLLARVLTLTREQPSAPPRAKSSRPRVARKVRG